MRYKTSLLASILILGSLLIVSLFVMAKAFTSPTETEIKKPVTLLDYQQEGKFDYLVYAKPSYLYGTSQTGQTIPQIPIQFIDSFDMSFTYQSAKQTPRDAEVAAVLENPGVWQKTVALVPKAMHTGDFTLTFSIDLKSFQDMADIIEKELGNTASSHNITIIATVSSVDTDSSQISEDFTQVLPIKLSKSFIKLGEDLIYRRGDTVGKFDYTVQLGPNTLFGPISLGPPSASANPTPKTLGTGDIIISKLVDRMDVSFSYHLEASKTIKQQDEEVEIEATAENPGKWSKTVVLIPSTNKSGDFTITFPLDLNRFNEIFDTIQKETGISASAYNLTIGAKVHTIAQTDFGMIDKTLTQSMTTNLREDVLAWTGDLKTSEPGSIKTTEIILKQKQYLGLSVFRARILWASVAGIVFALLMFSLVLYARRRGEKPTQIERKAQQAKRKYKDLIVETKDLPVVRPDEMVILLDSLEELIKAAQGLLKPVLHFADGQKHVYCVIDDTTRYQYVSQLAESTPSY